MRLKRLELFGFKSFADRTVLDFEHSVVGVVGPNGCGKSNVVDAVRWVLGEQRAKSMRGGEMTDVIFKGSSSRPAMSIAEVTITFDNGSGILDERGEEVSVTRRVLKSGEGEYLVDGDRVRLKDVREMLFGTGLGSRGYSVLEQGRIDAILSVNAQERRAIFEEAAGVSRYRQRKKETLSRLERVAADLLRLDDVVGELVRRERSLKIQAGKAQRFLAARDEWRVEGLRLARHQAHRLHTSIAETKARIGGLEEQSGVLRARRAEVEQDVATRQAEQETLSSEVERLNRESSELASELSTMDERRTQLGARVTAWKAASEEERQRGEGFTARVDERRVEADGLTRQAVELEASLDAARGVLEHTEKTLADVRARHEALRQEEEERGTEALRLYSERTNLENEIRHLDEKRESLSDRLVRAEVRLEEVRGEVEAARDAESEKVRVLERHEADLSELESERERVGTESASWTRKVEDLTEERKTLEVECARLGSRVESLLDREREIEGLEQGARHLFSAAQGGGLGLELHGLLADHLTTETRYARALDAALGSRSQAIVLSSPEDGRRAVEWLKAEASGRVHLLFSGAGTNGEEERVAALAAVAGQPGVGGALLDYARFEAGYERVARFLIGDVVVVETLAHAFGLVAEFPHLRFVTPEGDLVDAAGAVGGHFEVAQGAVGRRSSAAELAKERATVEARLAALEEELGRSRHEEEARKKRLVELAHAIEERGRERARVQGEAKSARARLEDLERALEVSEHETAGLTEEAQRCDTRRHEAGQRLVEVRQSHERAREELASLEQRRRDAEVERERLAADENRARVEVRALEERAGALERRRRDLRQALEELETELSRAQRLCAEHAQSATDGAAEAERIGAARVGLLERRGETEARLEELRAIERQGRERIAAVRQSGEELIAELEALQARVTEERLTEQRLELSRDEVVRRAQEDFALEEHQLLHQFTPESELQDADAWSALVTRVAELKASMEKLGVVNLEAVTELEEVAERLGFLQGQRGDLDEARRSLDGALRRLNEECETLFLETFDQVRENFRVLFRQLFGGGKADVSLAEGEDVLEAGIEIVARPPGRESLPITLLSGGQRTLTALAMLFALFRAKPSPFCVLDEVDAALDDANIGRFLSLLRHQLAGTQFLIVTHNKGTMSACELLYGVTMAVKGVSKVVSVEIEEVDEFVPEATGREVAAAEPTKLLTPAPRRSKTDVREGEAPSELTARGDAPPSEPGQAPDAEAAEVETPEAPRAEEAAPTA